MSDQDTRSAAQGQDKCPACGGEIVWHPRHGDRCDNCYAPKGDA